MQRPWVQENAHLANNLIDIWMEQSYSFHRCCPVSQSACNSPRLRVSEDAKTDRMFSVGFCFLPSLVC